MPDIAFFLNPEHWVKYKSLDKEIKKKINDKIRKQFYRELDKQR